jgi:HEAT repeat protein
MNTAMKFGDSAEDVEGLLNTLRDRLPTAVAESIEAELIGLDPRSVMAHVRQPHLESPFLLASLATVLAGWQRREADGSGMLLWSLIQLTSSEFPLMVRVAAVDALGQTGTEHPVPREQLKFLLRDADPGIRASAEDALANLGAE